MLAHILPDPNPLAHFWYWVEVHVGAINESNAYYGFWSGFGSDFGEVTLFGGLIVLVHHLNCGHKGCWRLHRHTTKDGHKLCKKHIQMPNSELDLHKIHPDHL